MTSTTARDDFDPYLHYAAIPASQYSYDALADIYNQTRIDYIVPMPMNARRLREYVEHYDIDLDASVVALNKQGEVIGINMLGLRGKRAWISRLGVIPERRGRKMGQFLMQVLLTAARERGAETVQLEVIEGNEPAHLLFVKCGFQLTRLLLVLRRPPGKLQPDPQRADDEVEELDEAGIFACLETRCPDASWIEETASLRNADSLQGLLVRLPNGEAGWVIYRREPFQLTHTTLCPFVSETLADALLYHLHSRNAVQDTKTENVPDDSPYLSAFARMGYLEVFRRLEMHLPLK